jgi:hypothetical protein
MCQRLSADWNAVDAELNALWEANPQHQGRVAWERLAGPLLARESKIREELGPLLLGWAEANRLGHYHVSSTGMVPDGWQPKDADLRPIRDSYKRIKEGTGLTVSTSRIRNLLTDAGWPRVEAYRDGHNAAARESWRSTVEAIPADEWPQWLDNYCATTPEGEATKRMLVELRQEMTSSRAAK